MDWSYLQRIDILTALIRQFRANVKRWVGWATNGTLSVSSVADNTLHKHCSFLRAWLNRPAWLPAAVNCCMCIRQSNDRRASHGPAVTCDDIQHIQHGYSDRWQLVAIPLVFLSEFAEHQTNRMHEGVGEKTINEIHRILLNEIVL